MLEIVNETKLNKNNGLFYAVEWLFVKISLRAETKGVKQYHAIYNKDQTKHDRRMTKI